MAEAKRKKRKKINIPTQGPIDTKHISRILVGQATISDIINAVEMGVKIAAGHYLDEKGRKRVPPFFMTGVATFFQYSTGQPLISPAIICMPKNIPCLPNYLSCETELAKEACHRLILNISDGKDHISASESSGPDRNYVEAAVMAHMFSHKFHEGLIIGFACSRLPDFVKEAAIYLAFVMLNSIHVENAKMMAKKHFVDKGKFFCSLPTLS